MKMIEGHEKNDKKESKPKVSEISHEIIFLFGHLYSISKKLK